MVNHIFLSYSRKDVQFMAVVRDHLRSQQLQVWTDESLQPGTPDWERAIEQKISTAGCVVVILSPDSRNSEWVSRELAMADSHKLRIFPVLLRGDDQTAVPLRLATTQRIDATENPTQALEELAAAVRRFFGIPPASSLTTNDASSSANSFTCVVAKIGPADYRTISDAVKNAPEGVRILVRPGLYHEQIVIDKPVEIVGDGPLKEIILESSSSDCIFMKTDYAVVRGLTLRLRVSDQNAIYYGVDIPQGRLVLENCDITSNSSACIGIHGPGADPIIRKCRIHDSKVSGIFIYDNSRATIDECDIYANTLSGIEIKSGADPIIQDCRVHDGKTSGILIFDKARGTISNCDIYANVYAGVEIKTGGNPTLQSCQIHDGKQGGVYVHDDGAGQIIDCDIYGNTYPSIEIRMGGSPNVQRCRIFDSKQSGIHAAEGSRGTISGCDIYGNALAGLEISGGGNPMVQNTQIRSGKTCGILVWDSGEGTITDCEIVDNAFAGIEVRVSGGPTVRNCRINRNGYEGIWVHDKGGGVYENNDLTENTKGALAVGSDCPVQHRGNKGAGD